MSDTQKPKSRMSKKEKVAYSASAAATLGLGHSLYNASDRVMVHRITQGHNKIISDIGEDQFERAGRGASKRMDRAADKIIRAAGSSESNINNINVGKETKQALAHESNKLAKAAEAAASKGNGKKARLLINKKRVLDVANKHIGNQITHKERLFRHGGKATAVVGAGLALGGLMTYRRKRKEKREAAQGN